MTLNEILEGIKSLSKVERGKVFEGKNMRLTEKDNSITELRKEVSALTGELKGYKSKETEAIHKETVETQFGKMGTIRKEHRDTIETLAGINIGDDDKTIRQKVGEISKQDRYSQFFQEKPSIASTLVPQINNKTSNNGAKTEDLLPL